MNAPPRPPPHIHPPLYHPLSPTLSQWIPLQCADIHALRTHGVYEANSPRELFYFGNTNHPVKWVRAVGVVVGVDEYGGGGDSGRGRMVYALDDGSGTVCECVCPGPATSTHKSAAAAPSTTAASTVSGSKPSNDVKAIDRTAAAAAPRATLQPSTDQPHIPYGLIDVGTVLKIKGKPSVFRSVHQIEIIKAEILRSTGQEVRCWDEMLAFRRDVLDVPWAVSREDGEKCRRMAERDLRGKRRQGEEKPKNRREDKRGKDGGVCRISKDVDTRTRGSGASREKEKGGLDPGNKVNYPSLAVRRRAKGKYDALGI